MRPRLANGLYSAAALRSIGLLVTSCATRAPTVTTDEHSALSTMERVSAQRQCLLVQIRRSGLRGLPARAGLNSYTGRPRILVVDKKHPTGRPSPWFRQKAIRRSCRLSAR